MFDLIDFMSNRDICVSKTHLVLYHFCSLGVSNPKWNKIKI